MYRRKVNTEVLSTGTLFCLQSLEAVVGDWLAQQDIEDQDFFAVLSRYEL